MCENEICDMHLCQTKFVQTWTYICKVIHWTYFKCEFKNFTVKVTPFRIGAMCYWWKYNFFVTFHLHQHIEGLQGWLNEYVNKLFSYRRRMKARQLSLRTTLQAKFSHLKGIFEKCYVVFYSYSLKAIDFIFD